MTRMWYAYIPRLKWKENNLFKHCLHCLFKIEQQHIKSMYEKLNTAATHNKLITKFEITWYHSSKNNFTYSPKIISPEIKKNAKTLPIMATLKSVSLLLIMFFKKLPV